MFVARPLERRIDAARLVFDREAPAHSLDGRDRHLFHHARAAHVPERRFGRQDAVAAVAGELKEHGLGLGGLLDDRADGHVVEASAHIHDLDGVLEAGLRRVHPLAGHEGDLRHRLAAPLGWPRR